MTYAVWCLKRFYPRHPENILEVHHRSLDSAVDTDRIHHRLDLETADCTDRVTAEGCPGPTAHHNPADIPQRSSETKQARRKLRTLKSTLAEYDFFLRVYERETLTREGKISHWPSDVDPRAEHSALASALQQAAAHFGQEVHSVELDCDEYPCLVSMTVDRRKTALEVLEQMEGYDDFALHHFNSPAEDIDPPFTLLLAFAPSTLDEDVQKRALYRLRQLETSAAAGDEAP